MATDLVRLRDGSAVPTRRDGSSDTLSTWSSLVVATFERGM